MKAEEELNYLLQRVIQLERENEELREGQKMATGLMMRGELMRESLMIKAICAGAFTKEATR